MTLASHIRQAGPLGVVALLQALAGARVLSRLARTARGETIRPVATTPSARVTIVVPVLNEAQRLRPCLDGLLAQGAEVGEILIVDGGSTDGTQALVDAAAGRDPRVRAIDAAPIPDGWNGKAWGLEVGARQASEPWLLTIDADVRPAPGLARALVAHAEAAGLPLVSVATRQQIESPGEGLLHPSMLTTLVYRYGIPGQVYRSTGAVQANGQCFLIRRDVLDAVGGFRSVGDEICEDVSLARRVVRAGYPAGFFEAGDLVAVRMYPDWRSTWRDWPRSLPMRDRSSGRGAALGLAEVLLAQALPLAALPALRAARAPRWATTVNLILACTRLGVLAGTRRAYVTRPWTYWLSPLADIPVAVRLIDSALRRRHVWRGRAIVRGGLQ